MCVRILLDKGARLDWRDASGEPALFKAAAGQNFEIADVLLDRGADPSEKGLIESCFRSPQSLRKILRRLPKPNSQDDDGCAPIYNATSSCQVEAIKILVEFGADVNIRTPSGNTPLIEAMDNGYLDVVRCLLDVGADVKFQDINNSVALHYAKTVEMIDILVKADADVNMADVDGYTALHYQVMAPPFDLLAIQTLIRAGANINAKNIGGVTPLVGAVVRNRLLLVDYLLTEDADPNNADQLLESALHWDVLVDMQTCSESDDQGLLEIIQYLVEVKGLNVNQVFDMDGTAVHLACCRDSSSVLRLLTDKEIFHADHEASDGIGRRPIHVAAARQSDCFEHLLNLGFDIRVTDKMGRSVLYWAAQGGNIDIVRRILDQPGVSINERNPDGWTALCWAARGPISKSTSESNIDRNSRAQVVNLLLKRGADKFVKVKAMEMRSTARHLR
ncbi:ankyrin repeat-containing domain protein [Trichoderma compactum]